MTFDRLKKIHQLTIIDIMRDNRFVREYVQIMCTIKLLLFTASIDLCLLLTSSKSVGILVGEWTEK